MKANPGWFLVIDNVDDPAAAKAVREFLDQVASARGHVLITSRLDDWGFGVEPLQLDLLSTEAAMEVLREATPHRTRTPVEDAALARLADEQLGCLSLALVQAAAYIEARRISFARYSEEFDRQAATVLAHFGETEASKLAYPKAVAQTWLVTFEQLGEEARLLLDMLAWLSIEPIPRSLWDVWPQEAEVDLEEGLTQLARYSFVRWEDGNTAITMHRLVQEVARDLQGRDEARRDEALEAVFGWLKAANTELSADDPRSWPILLPLLPHVLRLFGRTKDRGPFAEQSSVYGDAGRLLSELARYTESEAILRAALDRCEKRVDAAPIDVAAALFSLADLLQHLDQRIEAKNLSRRALAITVSTYGKHHPGLAEILNIMARLHRRERRLDAAKRLFRRAIRIVEKDPDKNQQNHAALFNNFGSLLEQQGFFEDAELLYRQAISIGEKFYGLDHLATGVYYNNLAGALMAKGLLHDAAELYRRSVVILLNTSKQCGHILPNIRAGVLNYQRCLTKLGLTYADATQVIDELMGEAGFTPSHLWKQIFLQPIRP